MKLFVRGDALIVFGEREPVAGTFVLSARAFDRDGTPRGEELRLLEWQASTGSFDIASRGDRWLLTIIAQRGSAFLQAYAIDAGFGVKGVSETELADVPRDYEAPAPPGRVQLLCDAGPCSAMLWNAVEPSIRMAIAMDIVHGAIGEPATITESRTSGHAIAWNGRAWLLLSTDVDGVLESETFDDLHAPPRILGPAQPHHAGRRAVRRGREQRVDDAVRVDGLRRTARRPLRRAGTATRCAADSARPRHDGGRRDVERQRLPHRVAQRQRHGRDAHRRRWTIARPAAVRHRRR